MKNKYLKTIFSVLPLILIFIILSINIISDGFIYFAFKTFVFMADNLIILFLAIGFLISYIIFLKEEIEKDKNIKSIVAIILFVSIITLSVLINLSLCDII